MSYIGLIGAKRLDPDNLLEYEQAEQMAKEKYDPIVIKIQTGWERGLDGYWRYEIADPFLDTQAIEDYIKPRYGQHVNIRMVLRDERILTAYPELEELTLYAMYTPCKGTAGYYNPGTNGMIVSMGKPRDGFDDQIEGVLLHKLRTATQDIPDRDQIILFH